MADIPEGIALPMLAELDIKWYLLLGLLAAFASWIEKRKSRQKLDHREIHHRAEGTPMDTESAQSAPTAEEPPWQRKLRDFVEKEIEQSTPRSTGLPPLVDSSLPPLIESLPPQDQEGVDPTAPHVVPVAMARVDDVYSREKPTEAPPQQKSTRHTAAAKVTSAGLSAEAQWLLSPQGPRQAVVGGIVLGPPRAMQQPSEW